MSVPHLTSSLAGRFWIWPLWLPASFISSSFTAYLGSHCAMKSVTPRSIWNGLAVTHVCQATVPGSPFSNSISKACGPFADTVCRGGVAQLLNLYYLAAGSSPLWGNIEAAFFQSVCSCQLIVKLILWIFVLCISEFQWWNSSFSFTQEILWIMFWFRNMTSIFSLRTGKTQYFRTL